MRMHESVMNGIRWSFVGHSYGEFMEKICLKAPKNYSASFWTGNFSVCLLENPQTTHFHDFEIFGRVPKPQNQLSLF